MGGSSHTATFHVVFDAEMWRLSGQDYVRKVRPKRMTQKPPDLAGGEVAIKFEATIPDAAFIRLMPVVELDISEAFWSSQPVTVVVPEPEDG